MSFPALQFHADDRERLVSLESITRITVGRAEDADVPVADSGMRAQQFEIYRVVHMDGPQYFLFDSGSREGVRVNGETVRNVRLQPGDMIETAGTVFTFTEREDLVVIVPDVRERAA